MHRERLEQMVVMLRGLPEEKFDLGTWHDEAACGTTACAVGWACVTPTFNNQGLHLDFASPAFEGTFGWGAVRKFFGISSMSGHHLFDSEQYVDGVNTTASEVADRIQSFLAEHAEAV